MHVSSVTSRSRTAAVAVLALAALSACGGGSDDDDSGGSGPDSARCTDFRYQEDAQAAFRDGARQLDSDGDGVACESLPGRPSSPTNPGGPDRTVQGLYEGTLTGSTSTHFQLLALDNGDVWSLYGEPSGNSFRVRGFIQGGTSRNGSEVRSSDVRDFGSNPAVRGTLSGSLSNAATQGSATFNGGSFSFTGTRVANSRYDYDRAADLSQITGTWSLAALDGTTARVDISSSGSFTGTNGGCRISGTIEPRDSGKNVFDVTVLSGAAPCAEPGSTASGVAISYLLQNSTRRELVVAGVNASRTAGNAFFGVR